MGTPGEETRPPGRPTDIPALICVDVEASGPNPSQYSLLSIGACTVAEPPRTFYVEVQPVNDRFVPEAMAINGLLLDDLAETGLPPATALARFESWVTDVVPPGVQPIFVAFNAPFDWMFINDYFHRYLGHNPFGHKALDIKAFYMGMRGVTWAETSHHEMGQHYLKGSNLRHHALQDAMDEAELFRRMLDEVAASRRPA